MSVLHTKKSASLQKLSTVKNKALSYSNKPHTEANSTSLGRRKSKKDDEENSLSRSIRIKSAKSFKKIGRHQKNFTQDLSNLKTEIIKI